MVPGVLEYGLLAAYLLLVVVVIVQYQRRGIPRSRLYVLVGTCFIWLAYGLSRITETTLVPPALDGPVLAMAALTFAGGLYATYRGWRRRGGRLAADG
jgi:NhaP-type Na+/H+ or K+/H+ antiporter